MNAFTISNLTLLSIFALTSLAGHAATVPLTVTAVGERPATQDRIVDTAANGEQRLDTFWTNRGNAAAAWATLDMGSTHTVDEIQLALRSDRVHIVAVQIGDSLTNNQVSTAAVANCTFPDTGQQVPTELTSCTLPPTSGRFLTLRVTNRSYIFLHAAVVPDNNPGGSNTPPVASFTSTIMPDSLSVQFDGAASSDPDGTIVGYDWTFGDGTSATGVFQDHSYTASGTYTASLTVTDDEGATNQASSEVTVETGTGGPNPLDLAVFAVGTRQFLAPNLIDKVGNGEQDLETAWRSRSELSTRWVTYDLGSPQQLTELRLAADGAHELTFNHGDSLNQQQVTGGTTSTCSIPNDGVGLPTELISCPITSTGRYLTAIKTNNGVMRINGTEAYGLTGNQPPQIMPIGPQTITEGAAFNLPVSAQDSDGPDPLVLSESNTLPGNPSILSSTGPGSAALEWLDSQGNPGDYQITVTATDAANAAASETFTLSVVANQPPVVSDIPDQNILENELLSLPLSASDDETTPPQFGEVHDLPGSPTVVTDNGDGTGSFDWTPATGDAGTYTVQISATDGEGLTGATSFEIEVLDPATAGVLEISAEEAPTFVSLANLGTRDWVHWGRGSGLETDRKQGGNIIGDYQIAEGGPVRTWSGTATRYSWSNGTPQPNITGLRDAARFISANNAFEFTVPATTANQTLQVFLGLREATGLVTATLSDGSQAPQTLALNQPSGRSTQLVSINFKSVTTDAVLTVRWEMLSSGNTVALEAALLAEAPNSPPELDPLADQSLTAGVEWTLPVTATDDGATPPVLTATSNLPQSPDVLTDFGDGTGLLRFTPPVGTPTGTSWSVTVTATDSEGLTSNQTITLTIANNQPPVLQSVPDQFLLEGATLQIGVSASDPDGPSPLLLNVLQSLPGNPVFVDQGAGSGVLTWQIPVGASTGSPYTLSIVATDGADGIANQSFLINVLPNSAPIIAPIADQTMIVGESRTITAGAADIDGPAPVSFSLIGTIPGGGVGLTDNGDGTASLLLNPTATAIGTHQLQVAASDGAGATSQTGFTLTVQPNQAPVITAPSTLQLQVGDVVDVDVLTSDPDGPLPTTISSTGTLPGGGVVFTDHGNGNATLMLSPVVGAAGGPYPFTFTATDALGNSRTHTTNITVLPRTLLLGIVGDVPTDVDLTEEGSLDWIHWGLDSLESFNRKRNVDSMINDVVQLGGTRTSQPVPRPVFSWDDGRPTRLASTTSATRFTGLNSGFRVNADAASERRRLTLYIAVRNATVRITTSGAGVQEFTLDTPEGLSTHRLTLEYMGSAQAGSLSVEAEVINAHDATASVGLAAATLAPAVDLAALSGLANRPANTSCTAPLREDTNEGFALAPAYPNQTFNQPTALVQDPADDSRWYVAERSGRVRFFNANNESAGGNTIYLNHTSAVSVVGENGLLDIAFDPNTAANNWVYLSYVRSSNGNHEMVLSRMKRNVDNTRLLRLSEQIILVQPKDASAHHAGDLVFDDQGHLFWSIGDDGVAGNDPLNVAQNPNDLRGTIVRIDLSNGLPYAIPPSNPFSAGGGAPEIYAYGFRIPRRMSWDSSSSQLMVADPGPGRREEINQVEVGGNYGWSCYEGTRANTHIDQTLCGGENYRFPIAEYGRNTGKAVTGGHIYRGASLPGLDGVYVFADERLGGVFGLFPDGADQFDQRKLFDSPQAISAFGVANNGELLALDSSSGQMHRLVSGTAPVGAAVAPLLSASGCVTPANPALPVQGVLPLELNATSWTDGASKEHFIALPDNGKVEVRTDGELVLPAGSVTLQHLRLDNKLIETRMLVRHDDGGWAGYSYEWNAGETDATLVDSAGKDAVIDGASWRFPGQQECSACHTLGAARTPGLTTAQLNAEVTYPGAATAANQLHTWEHLQLFATPLLATHYQQPNANPVDPNLALTERARSYLDANCAQCHQPGGNTESALDLRLQTPMAHVGACDVSPSFGDLGLAEARIIAPGSAANSVLLQRMATHDQNRMPPLGDHTIDSDGVTLINNWISNLATCPLPPPLPPLVDGDAITDNIVWDVPERVLQLGMENSEMWLSGFIDLSWWDGYDGHVIDPTGVQDSVTGINEVIRVAHNRDVAVYAPPGTYRVSREISMMKEDHPGENCASSSKKTNVFIGDPNDPPTFVLDENPSVDYNDPAAPRAVFHLWTQNGPGAGGLECELPEHVQANAEYEVNGELFNSIAANGFAQLLRNVKIDVGTGPKAGATCFKAQAAQLTYLEDIDCEARNGFAGSQSLPGRLGAVIDLEVRGGQHCLWLNESGTAEFAMNVKCTGQSDAVFAVNGRAPTTLIGFEIEHDLSHSPVFRSLDEEFHFTSSAGTTQFIDGKITLTGASATANNPVWQNTLGRNWHISNVYVTGAGAGQPLINGLSESTANPAGAWTHVKDYQFTSRDTLSPPLPNGNRVRYNSNPSFAMIDGATLSKTTVANVIANTPPPANIRSQHELADTPFFLDPDVINTLFDLGISNRGSGDSTAALQAAIDNHAKVFVPKGIYFIGSPGLMLGENSTLFSHNLSFTRLLWNPDYVPTNPEGSPLITTVDSATATTRFEGFRIYRYGASGEEEDYPQTLVHWRAGAKSIWGWGQGELYLPGPSPLIGQPGKLYRYTGNGGGRRIMFYDGQDNKTAHADHYRLVIEDTTGQPLTLYNYSPEHEEGPHAQLLIRNASNVRAYGNKSECTRRFASIDNSDNVALYGQGVGCTSQPPPVPPLGGYIGPDVEGLPIISITGDSTNVRIVNSVPTLWHPTALSLIEEFQGQVNTFPNASSISLFQRGAGDFSGTVFNHQP